MILGLFVELSKTLGKKTFYSPEKNRIPNKRFFWDLEQSIAANHFQPIAVLGKKADSRVTDKDLSCVLPVIEAKHSASVMVFRTAANDGEVMPLHFLEADLKINIQYCGMFEDFGGSSLTLD